MYCICGAEENLFIKFILSIFESNDYYISCILIIKLTPIMTDVTVAPWVASRNRVTMWMKASSPFS